MNLLLSVLSVVAGASATDSCDVPRSRDTGALTMAVAQDRQVAAAFQKASAACVKDSESCDQARLECGTLLASTLKLQVGFDEGAWLRDLLMPYLGQTYPITQKFAATAQATDTSCAGETAALAAAAGRRTAQAAKRQTILEEYPKYVTWVNSTFAKCREQAGVDAQKAIANRSEAEKLAAAALAAKLAEEAKQRSDDEVRQKAEAELKAKAELQKKLEDEAKARARAEASAKKTQEDAAEKQKKDQGDAAKRAKQAEDVRLVAEREGRLNQAKTQKSQIVTDAKADLERATDEANAKQKAAMKAVEERSPAAAMLATEAANAEKARAASEQRLADAKVKADRIELDESSERSRGSIGVQGIIGYGTLGSSEGQASGVAIGAQASAHFGFWGTAPADGMASGLEVRLNARYQTQLGTGVARGFDGRAAVRWFFGRFGVGAAVEYRLFESSLGTSGRTFSALGLGPSVGVAFIDTPSVRVMFNLAWLPVVANDLLRFVGEIEIAYRFLFFGIAGGTQTDPTAARLGFVVTGLVGVRLCW